MLRDGEEVLKKVIAKIFSSLFRVSLKGAVVKWTEKKSGFAIVDLIRTFLSPLFLAFLFL